MGPRLFSHGYEGFKAYYKSWLVDGFQWGHGFSAVDTGLTAFAYVPFHAFQWGHGFSAMGT